MEPLLAITNAVALLIVPGTNLISAGRFYPNSPTEAPYVLHYPQAQTNHTLVWVYRNVRYEYTFLTEYGSLQTNQALRTPITSP